MMTSIISFVVVRQVFLGIILKFVHKIEMIGVSYSATWILAMALTSGYYFMSHWLAREENAHNAAA